eukprot:scaffold113233_cov63-Phaeocystis_antarctica.AAC.2
MPLGAPRPPPSPAPPPPPPTPPPPPPSPPPSVVVELKVTGTFEEFRKPSVVDDIKTKMAKASGVDAAYVTITVRDATGNLISESKGSAVSGSRRLSESSEFSISMVIAIPAGKSVEEVLTETNTALANPAIASSTLGTTVSAIEVLVGAPPSAPPPPPPLSCAELETCPPPPPASSSGDSVILVGVIAGATGMSIPALHPSPPLLPPVCSEQNREQKSAGKVELALLTFALPSSSGGAILIIAVGLVNCYCCLKKKNVNPNNVVTGSPVTQEMQEV